MSILTTPFDREQIVARAKASTTNVANTCQLWTRGICGAPSVGDYDGDGASDAEDGWKSEPAEYRHTDRNPPAGVPVSYGGGSHDNGHRAISLGGGMIRSTDAAGTGHVATVSLDWPERVWGLTYLGWSDTCDGYLIPKPTPPKPKPEPLTPEQKARVVRRQAGAVADEHPNWARRLRAWAKRISNGAKG
jgi:hypothetical protein